jgi:hypothetical protein
MHSEGRQVITVQLEIIIGAIRRVLANEFSGPRKNPEMGCDSSE